MDTYLKSKHICMNLTFKVLVSESLYNTQFYITQLKPEIIAESRNIFGARTTVANWQ